MRWLDPNSRIAVTLRRLRGRFGISAPRMAVRTHVPWHWRAASIIVITAASLALAGWVYDAGRRIAGLDSAMSHEAVAELRAKISSMESELEGLRSANSSSTAKLQIEKTAQEQMAQQVKALETENARLKEDLAVFENMSQGQAAEGTLGLARLRVEALDSTGNYRYQLLVTQQQGKKGSEFRGSLQLALTVSSGNDNVMITLPKAGEASAEKYAVRFRHFRRLEGTFKVPDGSRLKAIEARLIQDGAVKATQRIAL